MIFEVRGERGRRQRIDAESGDRTVGIDRRRIDVQLARDVRDDPRGDRRGVAHVSAAAPATSASRAQL